MPNHLLASFLIFPYFSLFFTFSSILNCYEICSIILLHIFNIRSKIKDEEIIHRFFNPLRTEYMKISPYLMWGNRQKKSTYVIEPSLIKNKSNSDCRIENNSLNFTNQTFLVEADEIHHHLEDFMVLLAFSPLIFLYGEMGEL